LNASGVPSVRADPEGSCGRSANKDRLAADECCARQFLGSTMRNEHLPEDCYQDRRQAGRVLATYLHWYTGLEDLVILGLPRGGMPVAHEVATALGAALDVFVVRKLGVPQQPELAMGAIASGGVRVLNEDVIRAYHISSDAIEAVAQREETELARRERA